MSSPISRQRPNSRYGSARRNGPRNVTAKMLAVGAVLLVLVAIFFAVRYVQQREDNPVDVSLVTQERLDDDLMRVWVDISRPDTSQDSYCIVTALNYAMAEVGRREVPVPAGGDNEQRIAVDVPTRDYPVAGGVYGCSTSIPAHLDVHNPVYTF